MVFHVSLVNCSVRYTATLSCLILVTDPGHEEIGRGFAAPVLQQWTHKRINKLRGGHGHSTENVDLGASKENGPVLSHHELNVILVHLSRRCKIRNLVVDEDHSSCRSGVAEIRPLLYSPAPVLFLVYAPEGDVDQHAAATLYHAAIDEIATDNSRFPSPYALTMKIQSSAKQTHRALLPGYARSTACCSKPP